MRVTDLRALRDKYEEMLRLRVLHARARDDSDFLEPDPRAAMAELARAFPGALREIDELPIEVIRARIDELAVAENDTSSIAPWMHAQARFHALARGALAVKRWLGARLLTPEVEASFAHALTAMGAGEREDAAAWSEQLAAIAKPPRGRLMELVHARLAAELGLDRTSAKALVLAPRSSLRRRRA